jgi:multidrug transporter EmrE-like cation transporter
MMTYLAAIVCVVCIAVGQILFKLTSVQLQKSGSYFDPSTATLLISALALYGLTTLGWIWVLQKIPLGRAYPLMALAFVLVPLASYFIFNERYSMQYMMGMTMIVLGIALTVNS